MSAPTNYHMIGVTRVLRYIVRNSCTGIFFKSGTGLDSKLESVLCTDAEFAGDRDTM